MARRREAVIAADRCGKRGEMTRFPCPGRAAAATKNSSSDANSDSCSRRYPPNGGLPILQAPPSQVPDFPSGNFGQSAEVLQPAVQIFSFDAKEQTQLLKSLGHAPVQSAFEVQDLSFPGFPPLEPDEPPPDELLDEPPPLPGTQKYSLVHSIAPPDAVLGQSASALQLGTQA
jgi:hypothetical protein